MLRSRFVVPTSANSASQPFGAAPPCVSPPGRLSFCAMTVVSGLVAGAMVSSLPAQARNDRDERLKAAEAVLRPTEPLKLVVSIRRQRVAVYEGLRKIAESPISSGMSGHETPTGVFSIIEKNRVHFSNLYNNAPMPFMQRITWSGVALHAGALPGYPASHGCIRLPFSFARQLFDLTRVGARVIVARDEVEPRAISHPHLPVPLPPAEQVADASPGVEALIGISAAKAAAPFGVAGAYVPQRTRASVEAARAAEIAALADKIRWAEADRDTASARAREAAAAAEVADHAVAGSEAARDAVVRSLQSTRRAEATIESEIKALVTRNAAVTDEARLSSLALREDELEDRFVSLSFEIEDLERELAEQTAVLAERVAMAATQKSAKAETAAEQERRVAAVKQAQAEKTTAERRLQRRGMPVTVFVSRKSGKLSVRQGFEPLFEEPIAVEHADQPLGTHVFTASGYEAGERGLAWNVVSVAAAPSEPEPRRSSTRKGEEAKAPPRNVVPQTAAMALQRLQIPASVMERVAEFMKPGSSLIVSDLDMSHETGRGTDFIVLTRN